MHWMGYHGHFANLAIVLHMQNHLTSAVGGPSVNMIHHCTDTNLWQHPHPHQYHLESWRVDSGHPVNDILSLKNHYSGVNPSS